jgi:hypothetical protein
MAGECILTLTQQDLALLAKVFDCQVDALPVVVYEACVAAVRRAVEADEWDEDRLPTYDEYPLVDLAKGRLVFIPNTPARDVMDWLAGAAGDLVEGRIPGGMRAGKRAEALAQSMAQHLGYEVEPAEMEAAPTGAAATA